MERSPAMIRSVVFDVGECLVGETREYATWADWPGVPRHTFSAVLGAVIARGLDYREACQVFQPRFDLTVERRKREEAGQAERFGEDDIYPDVRPALKTLCEEGCGSGWPGTRPQRRADSAGAGVSGGHGRDVGRLG